MVVWSEIMSYIKGAPNSYQNENFHLRKENYLNYIGAHKTYLQSADKGKIWDLAQDFEKWKMENNYFDLMDVISYLLSEITQVTKITKLHFILILIFEGKIYL